MWGWWSRSIRAISRRKRSAVTETANSGRRTLTATTRPLLSVPLKTRAAPPRRLVYFGTPEMAVPPLRALVTAGFEIGLVVTRIDKRRGRGSQLMPSEVKAAAVELGLPVSHAVDDALAVGADLGVVVAFGQLIKPHILDVLPMVNLHFSLLPRWRGAAPVERAAPKPPAETVDLRMR